jgi:hypothetical protein
MHKQSLNPKKEHDRNTMHRRPQYDAQETARQVRCKQSFEAIPKPYATT